jgi:hypothetical protein
LLNEKKCFTPEDRNQIVVHMDNSMCHNEHRVVNELRHLKILRVPHPPDSPDISLCHFWMFRDFKGKLTDCDLQGPEEILTAFQESWDNITFEELQMAFESCPDRLRWIIEPDEEYFRK